MIAERSKRGGDGAEPIVRVEGLSKSFGQQKAVDNVSFEVRQGEIFGFLGPNGAGKSTTINMLTTLLPPTSGKAEVCGFDVHKHANEVRRKRRGRPAGLHGGRGHDRLREHTALRRPLRHPSERLEAPRERASAAGRASGRREEEGEHLLGRDAEEAGARLRPHQLPQAALPRRADARARRSDAHGRLEVHPPAQAGLQHDALPDDPLPRGGRLPLRQDRDHRPRPHRQDRHA